MNAGELWSAFVLDPRVPAHAAMRASDTDRDRIQGVLAEAFSDGRLDRDEYDDRTATLLASRTLGALPPLVVDLVPERGQVVRGTGTPDLADAVPADLQARAERAWESERRGAVLTFLGPSLICWAVWTATCLGAQGFELSFPWPLIVMAATGFHALRTLASHRAIVIRELDRLEKKQAKAVAKRLHAESRELPPTPPPTEKHQQPRRDEA